MGDQAGARNPNWKGGRVIEPRGYVLIRVGVGHPLADVRGYAYEHRLVAAERAKLLPGLVVHHENERTGDNDPSNLEPLTRAEHGRRHRKYERGLRNPGEPNPMIECACACGTRLRKFDEAGRPRSFVTGHNPMPSPTMSAITDSLRAGPLHRSELVHAIGASSQAIASCLSKMRRAGLVEPLGHGVWMLVQKRGGSDG